MREPHTVDTKLEMHREKQISSRISDLGCSTVLVVLIVCGASIKVMLATAELNQAWWGAVAVLGLSLMGTAIALTLLKRL